MNFWSYHAILLATGCAAGIINALAGGGPILTLGVLALTGMDPRIANLTTTVALSPGQMAAGFAVRNRLWALRLCSPVLLVALAVAGGALGAQLLLLTAAAAFKQVVPWLVLLATVMYAASSAPRTVTRTGAITNGAVMVASFTPMTVYGGYFGGGNSFLVLALLGLSGHDPRLSGELKNILIAAINSGAFGVFALSGAVNWSVALSIGAGGLLGSLIGARLLGSLSIALVRALVVLCGVMLSAFMLVS